MALPSWILISAGGRRSQRPGPSPTLGSLGPSHQWRHKSRVSLRGPPCALGVSDIPYGEVRNMVSSTSGWICRWPCMPLWLAGPPPPTWNNHSVGRGGKWRRKERRVFGQYGGVPVRWPRCRTPDMAPNKVLAMVRLIFLGFSGLRMGMRNSNTLRSLRFRQFPRWKPSFGSGSAPNFPANNPFWRPAHPSPLPFGNSYTLTHVFGVQLSVFFLIVRIYWFPISNLNSLKYLSLRGSKIWQAIPCNP